jgi:Tol biopolymer transport system component
MNALRALAALGLLALSSACARTPQIEPEQLPAEPIAFVFIDPVKAREISERIAERKKQGLPGHPGVARIDQLAKLFKSDSEVFAAELIGRASLLDPRSASATPLETLPKGARPLEWSRDHSRLLFAAPRFDVYQLTELQLATGELRTYTQGGGDHPSGSLATDGTLAYSEVAGASGARPGDARIFVRSPGGGEPRPVTSGPADISPTWSPDGSALVYQTRGADGNLAIALLQPIDGAPRLLARGLDPVFTPDGQWIVYSQRLAVGTRLWRMRPDGSGKLALGEAPTVIGDERHPAVSPDGRYVAYVADDAGRRTLRVRRFDGGGDRELFDAGDGVLPVW